MVKAGTFFPGQLRQGAQGLLVPGVVERPVVAQHGIDLVGQDQGHQLEDFLALVADQGQLVVHGLGRRRVVRFELVLDGLDQGFFGEGLIVVVVMFAHGFSSWAAL